MGTEWRVEEINIPYGYERKGYEVNGELENGESVSGTINDGKEIVHIIKDDKKEEDKDIEETEK